MDKFIRRKRKSCESTSAYVESDLGSNPHENSNSNSESEDYAADTANVSKPSKTHMKKKEICCAQVER